MKSSIRLLAALVFFTVGINLNSFGSSVLCQSLPVSVSANYYLKTLFTCNIPANAVATGKSLRVTVNLHSVNSGTSGVVSYLEFNGNEVDATSTPAQSVEQNWSFIVTNTGGTGCSIGGTTTAGSSTLALGPGTVYRPPIPWSSGWTLQIWVSYSTATYYTVDGDTFLVEILD